MKEDHYTQTAHLTGGHTKGITALAFNPAGHLLASAALDGSVCIWDTTTWKMLYVYYAKTGITSLAWFTDEALICGLQDGILSSIVKAETALKVSGRWAHRYPVERLAVNGDNLATGAHKEVSIWAWDKDAERAVCQITLPSPGANDSSEDEDGDIEAEDPQSAPTKEILVTGVYWASRFLIVAYLNHGIRFYDKEAWKLFAHYDTKYPAVCTSLSPNGAFLAATNTEEGFDIYDLDNGKVIRSFVRDAADNERAVPVLFIHGGHAILGGSMTGTLNIWYIDQSRQLEPLHMPNADKVLAVADYFYADTSRFVLATGVMNEESPSSVIIWSSRPGEELAPADDEVRDSSLDPEPRSSGSVVWAVFRMLSYSVVGAAALVAIMVIVHALLYVVWQGEELNVDYSYSTVEL